jgi:CRISPR-associated protein Cas5d
MPNSVEFKVWGRYALFTDPLTRVGGEKTSYQVPTYEALKGILSSVYWKPTFVWVIDHARVMKLIRTQTRAAKPLRYTEGGSDLSFYTYLADVEYQVRAHFEWNLHRPDLAQDRDDRKHHHVARRMIQRGGRRDVFLGTRECQGYVEECVFGEGSGAYDLYGDLSFGLMFHSFDYPDENGHGELWARFWRAEMTNGVIAFAQPGSAESDPRNVHRAFVRRMAAAPPASVGLNEPGLLHDYTGEDAP